MTSRSRPSSILVLPSSECIMSSSSSISSTAPTRRIKFAPLPEPNREDHHPQLAIPQISISQGDTDTPTEDLVASWSSSSSSSSQLSSSTNSTPRIHAGNSSPDSSVGSSPITQLTPLSSKHSSLDPIIVVSNTNTNNPASPLSSPPSAWSKKPNPLLRPFKRYSTSSSGSSSHTLTPTPSVDRGFRKSFTKEEIFTLGAVNLFRTASRESTRSAHDNDTSSLRLGLIRWASLGTSNTNLSTASPQLSRTQSVQSTQSYKSKSHSRFFAFSSSSSSSLSSDSKTKSKPTPVVHHQPGTNRHKGTRMLNGRVYGGPKKNANPFANARDEEPEFVEWGYGGMGSVKGAKSAGVSSNWERLQGGSAMTSGNKPRIHVGVGGVGAGIGAIDADMDDGSGLAWVKRRKEERARKEQEQKEKEAEKENSESQMNTPVPTRSNTLETNFSMPAITLPPSVLESAAHISLTTEPSPLNIVLEEDGETSSTPTPPRYLSELGVSSVLKPSSLTEDSISKPKEGGTSQLHNNVTTHENERVLQAVTVPVRAPRLHHRQSSKGSSREVFPYVVTEVPVAVGANDSMDASTGTLHTSTITPIDNPTTPSSSSSGSESESEVDDADDEDDEEEEPHAKNTLGDAAGVEKISRHNKD